MPRPVPKYRDPLLVPTAMPRTSAGAVDRYVIGVRQFRQQVLPHGFPRTTLWGYGSETRRGTYSSPSLTIEARAGRPVEVTWVNGLVNRSTGRYLPHLLPVDPTLHWANPPVVVDGRDMHPEFASTPEALPRPGAGRGPPARWPHRGGERRLPRVVVPAATLTASPVATPGSARPTTRCPPHTPTGTVTRG